MNIHKNARLTPLGRERIVRQVESGHTPEAVAEAAGVWPRTVRKWVDRYRREVGRDCRIARLALIGCDGRRLGRSSTQSNVCDARSAPAEDCGGIHRFYQILDALADPPPQPRRRHGWAEDYDPPSIHRINAGCTRATDTGSKEPPFRSGLADLLGSASWNPSSRNRTARPTARR
ncbi:MAG: hypothetical protein E5Y04_29985 [Mesorhizobium sp.]|uniref:leucine zipper domain-containing protein n=1 Tax=unclassified Mesorhizobium TaxID=325217 RepID=UPI000FCB9E4D|nr:MULTISPECIES: leucine zipper domain-containing protein [unclassified Mesorhizobium]AZV19410.1 hypothetical protein EJ079_10290 [Mesorhizobium sp. M7A.F.Ce.TU.012.03.2.1]MDF3156479.1 leucine zipper domain-containing protein [Mesorhizobium sp. XAP10]MDF3249336.1 leucine zipper domain-containing protein [Mesorhizobium sp. XAP4]RUV33376.1 hypothetical protein EOB49_30775 [Mesorhizobium sp. M7A.F.Ca.MR.148.00.0.0]RWN25180.1 MAG: hypothetical protein EOR97_32265 [Mesorhizobium sp.]